MKYDQRKGLYRRDTDRDESGTFFLRQKPIDLDGEQQQQQPSSHHLRRFRRRCRRLPRRRRPFACPRRGRPRRCPPARTWRGSRRTPLAGSSHAPTRGAAASRAGEQGGLEEGGWARMKIQRSGYIFALLTNAHTGTHTHTHKTSLYARHKTVIHTHIHTQHV